MLKTIKAKFTDGVLVPLEPVEFEDGDEILLSFDDEPTQRRVRAKYPRSVLSQPCVGNRWCMARIRDMTRRSLPTKDLL